MTNQELAALTGKELAEAMIGQLETLGADWDVALDTDTPDGYRLFAEQVLKPMEDLMREAARRLAATEASKARP